MSVENDPELSLNARIDIIDVTNNTFAVMQCFIDPKKHCITIKISSIFSGIFYALLLQYIF